MKIYSVRTHNDKSLIYYGYTKQPLFKRLYDYRSRYKRHLKNCDNFLIVYDILNLKGEYIVLEKEIDTDNKDIVKGVLNQFISENECLNRKDMSTITEIKHDILPKNNIEENERIENNQSQSTNDNLGLIKLQPVTDNSNCIIISDIQNYQEQQQENERLEKQQLEKERLEKEQLEKERLEKEQQEKKQQEKEQQEKEQLEKERLEKEKLEKERLEKEKLEKERLYKEQQKKEQLEKEQLEKDRIHKEQQEKEQQEKEQLEKERLYKEQLEKERLYKEQQKKEQQEKEQLEKERLYKEQQERDRIHKEQLEKEQHDIEDKNKYIKNHKSWLENCNKNSTIKLNKHIYYKTHKANKNTLKVIKC